MKWIYLIDQRRREIAKFQATVEQAKQAVKDAGRAYFVERDNEHQAVIVVW